MKAIKTKIIATIGPSTNTYDSLKKLHKAGMNVARINMSHATHADAQNIIDLVHQINSEQSVDHGPIGLLLDTQGPEQKSFALIFIQRVFLPIGSKGDSLAQLIKG